MAVVNYELKNNEECKIKQMKKRKSFVINIIKSNINNFLKIIKKLNYKYFHLKEDCEQILGQWI